MQKYNFSPESDNKETLLSNQKVSRNTTPNKYGGNTSEIQSPIKKDGRKRIIEISSLERDDEFDNDVANDFYSGAGGRQTDKLIYVFN